MTNVSNLSEYPCRDVEPGLAELLNDAVLQSLLASDGIDRAELEAVISRAQRRLGTARAKPSITECCA